MARTPCWHDHKKKEVERRLQSLEQQIDHVTDAIAASARALHF